MRRGAAGPAVTLGGYRGEPIMPPADEAGFQALWEGRGRPSGPARVFTGWSGWSSPGYWRRSCAD